MTHCFHVIYERRPFSESELRKKKREKILLNKSLAEIFKCLCIFGERNEKIFSLFYFQTHLFIFDSVTLCITPVAVAIEMEIECKIT